MIPAQPKIHEALLAIMAEIRSIPKAQKNKAQGFAFRGIDDIYAALQPSMIKHGVYSAPIKVVTKSRAEIISSAKAKGWLTVNTYTFRFTAQDGSFIDVESDGEAADYGDKGSSKCASIAHKYAFLQLFCIPTEDRSGDEKDPDFYSHEIVSPPPTPTRAPKSGIGPKQGISEAQIKRLYAIASSKGWQKHQVEDVGIQAFHIEEGFEELTPEQYNRIVTWVETKTYQEMLDVFENLRQTAYSVTEGN